MPTGKRTEQWRIDLVRANFANHTKQELSDMAGVSCSTIDRIQAVYGLRKSREHLHEMGVRAGKASNIARGGDSSSCYTPEAIAKRVATYKARFKTERARVIFGLEQKTKMRVKVQPHPKCNQRSYLKKLGYIIDEKEMIAYYTPQTHRAKRMEAQPRKYYYFKPFENEN